MTIAIVPGHGGRNRGTQAGGFDEADWVLEFGHELARKCVGFWPHLRTELIRRTDIHLGLTQAARLCESYQAAIALVLHVDSCPGLTGGSVYIMHGQEVLTRAGCAVLNAYPEELRPRRPTPWQLRRGERGWQRAARNVLVPYLDAGVPALLCELYYASSPRDCIAANEGDVRERLCLALMAGVSVALA